MTKQDKTPSKGQDKEAPKQNPPKKDEGQTPPKNNQGQKPPKKPKHHKKPAPPHVKNRTVYIVDTNVLHMWLSYKPDEDAPDWAKSNPKSWENVQKRQQRAARFCRDETHRIIIPEIVWVELCGLFLQKDIDLHNYLNWQQKRRIALQEIEAYLLDPLSHIRLGQDQQDAELAINLCRYQISETLLKRMRESHEKRPTVGGNPRSVKLLDGIDSAILAYAWCYAEKHPELYVRLCSDDHGLRQMLPELHRARHIRGRLVPSNLGARDLWGNLDPDWPKLHLLAPDDHLEREARRLFNAGDYVGAIGRWQERLGDSPNGPSQQHMFISLASGYQAWSQFDYKEAAKALTAAIESLGSLQKQTHRQAHGLDDHHISLLEQQAALCQKMAALWDPKENQLTDIAPEGQEIFHILLRDLKNQATQYHTQQRYNELALVLYRIMECLAQRRLLLHKISAKAPDYEQCGTPPDELLALYNKTAMNAPGGREVDRLPGPIGMVSGYILLHSLKDPLVDGLSLNKLCGIMKTRNQTIFAHGFHSVTLDQARRMRQLVDQYLERFWVLEGLTLKQVLQEEKLHQALTFPDGPYGA